MSQENVGIVRAFFEAWNAGDMNALRDLVDPDVILRTVKDWPEPGPYVGREAVVRFTEQLRETFDADTLEPIGDFVDIADHVVARLTWSGEGHGPRSNIELTDIFTVRNGKILSHEFFWDHADALQAVGLSEQAMLKENVELVRSIHAAWERGDYSSAEWAHTEIEYVHADGPDTGSWIGLTGMAEAFRNFLSAWEEFRVEAEQYRELDAERVLVLFQFSGRGKTSGLEAGQIRTTGAQLFHVRGGKVTRLVQYWDREHALADLDLASETGSSRS